MEKRLASSHALPPTPPPESTADVAESVATLASMTAAPAKHIWVVTGPAGCGKTSVAESLQAQCSMPYLEGDSFHTPENVKKMAEGHPLTDSDRWDWLVLLRHEAMKTLTQASGVIVTCSALKRKYRDVIRVASYHHPEVQVHFLYLNVTEALVMDRVRARQGHYMKDTMVHSQFESLEAPQADETDVLSIDASGSSKEVQALAGKLVKEVMQSLATTVA